MRQNAYIAGVGMTYFGKHLDRGLKSLATGWLYWQCRGGNGTDPVFALTEEG